MSKTPFIPLYTSDFLGGTGGMTASTKGVYITLLCLMYESEQALPQQWDTLARRCGCSLPAFKRAIQSLIDDGKIAISEAGIWSDKCEKHIMQRRERSDSATSAAKTRWQKSEQIQGKADATASVPQCKPEPYPEPLKREAKASPKKGTRLPDNWVLPKEFGEWAISEGWPESSIREQALIFKDYWIGLSGQRAVKQDWLATWRNWMRKNTKSSKQKGNGHDKLDAALEAGRQWDRDRAMDQRTNNDTVVPLLPARRAGTGNTSGHD
jgi:uncharacterized protein YdaU (DUF1376 family)